MNVAPWTAPKTRRAALVLLWGALTAAPLACLMLNGHAYPSEDVDRTAEQIIDDIRGQTAPRGRKEESPGGKDTENNALSLGWHLVGAAPAAGRGARIPTPAIEAVRGKLKERSRPLGPYSNAGAIGEANSGLVVLRDVSSLPTKDRTILNRLVKEENADRMILYREVAKALGVKRKDLPKVQTSFAKAWRETARPGWWIQEASGTWHKR